MKNMKKNLVAIVALPLLCSVLLLAGCTVQSNRLSSATLYDLGPLPAVTAPAGPAISISVADVTPSAWLDSPLMFYRLAYANDQQPRAYAQHRWVMQPTQLFSQRLKGRITQAGGVAASAVDGPTNLSLLRLEADDFSHVFDTPEQSYGSVALRASVYHGRTLVAQKTFTTRTPAPSGDAEGGARSLAAASDKTITDMIAWLATLPLLKR